MGDHDSEVCKFLQECSPVLAVICATPCQTISVIEFGAVMNKIVSEHAPGLFAQKFSLVVTATLRIIDGTVVVVDCIKGHTHGDCSLSTCNTRDGCLSQ